MTRIAFVLKGVQLNYFFSMKKLVQRIYPQRCSRIKYKQRQQGKIPEKAIEPILFIASHFYKSKEFLEPLTIGDIIGLIPAS